MGNENKWEYDYSSQNRPEGGTGYPNVGSSGMNTANQYNDPQPEARAAEPETADGAGGTTPPEKEEGHRQAHRTQCGGAGAGCSHGLCRRLCGRKVRRQW